MKMVPMEIVQMDIMDLMGLMVQIGGIVLILGIILEGIIILILFGGTILFLISLATPALIFEEDKIEIIIEQEIILEDFTSLEKIAIIFQ